MSQSKVGGNRPNLGQSDKVLIEHLRQGLVMMVQQEEQAKSPFVASNALNSIIILHNITNAKVP